MPKNSWAPWDSEHHGKPAVLRRKLGHENTGPMYERVLQQPIPQKRSLNFTPEDSNLHYADIQVYSRMQPRSASEVKHLHLATATEYATLHFPHTAPQYDSKNGTLV
uniref:uncharacterized protein C11orf52 homolog isoform X2 n=1 Tax=Jaculus jaculus TaxID=51337 RepID=UPI001E1AF9E6|nr:uncharacterized protein C11orf52 homolog isoform X2 [Jaculus jaculus]